MIEHPYFSVIIPLYNKAPYVDKAIKSVLAQTFRDYELIIVDDGSKDNSAEKAAKAIERQNHCHLIQQKNQGVSITRNNGVAFSKGEYLCFLDADDWWEPSFLEEMMGIIKRYPHAGIYGTGYWIVKNNKKRLAPIGVDKRFTEGEINYYQVYAKTLCMPLWTGAVCIPRIVFGEMQGFNPGLNLGEDFDLWVRISLKYPVVFLTKPLSNYNQDVDVTFRGTRKKKYNPDSFMTFHFDQFSKSEQQNHDLKILLDRIRVYTLLNFRKHNLFPEKVQHEIAKVDFLNVGPIYRFYYHAPYWMIKIYCNSMQQLSNIKQKILK